MTNARFNKLRLLRMVVWILLMGGTSVAVVQRNPRKVVYVPCIFLAVMVPMVLLPLKNKGEGKA